jgi:hypothetical protein
MFDDCPPHKRRLFNRNGWIDLFPIDARDAIGRFPADWSERPWRRPEGTQFVNVPLDWQDLPYPERIQLARATGAMVQNIAEVDSIISKYLAGTTHPDSAPQASS